MCRIRIPVKFRHPALSGINLLDIYRIVLKIFFYNHETEKFTWRLQIVKHEQLLSVRCITTYFFRDGDVNCSFANSSEFYIPNTSKQCKVNHKIWPW